MSLKKLVLFGGGAAAAGLVASGFRGYGAVTRNYAGPPANSFFVVNRDGIPETWKYRADCYEVQTYFTPTIASSRKKVEGETEKASAASTLTPEIPILEEALVQYANSFLDTPFFHLETLLLGYFTGNKRPERKDGALFPFHVGGPMIAMWKVEHRTSNEILMRWTYGGTSGRTWLSVEAREPEDASAVARGAEGSQRIPVKLKFGSSLWFNAPSASREQGDSMSGSHMADRFHSIYSTVLLAQARRVFDSRQK